MTEEWPNFAFSYSLDGSDWEFQLPAKDLDDAKRRLIAIAYTGRVDGEVVTSIRCTVANLDGDLPEVIVCAGPPECALQGDEAIAAANAGCLKCQHILVSPDGSTTEFQRKAN
jgi:hypothetical protein